MFCVCVAGHLRPDCPLCVVCGVFWGALLHRVLVATGTLLPRALLRDCTARRRPRGHHPVCRLSLHATHAKSPQEVNLLLTYADLRS